MVIMKVAMTHLWSLHDIVLRRFLAEDMPVCTKTQGTERDFARWTFPLTISTETELKVLETVFFWFWKLPTPSGKGRRVGTQFLTAPKHRNKRGFHLLLQRLHHSENSTSAGRMASSPGTFWRISCWEKTPSCSFRRRSEGDFTDDHGLHCTVESWPPWVKGKDCLFLKCEIIFLLVTTPVRDLREKRFCKEEHFFKVEESEIWHITNWARAPGSR